MGGNKFIKRTLAIFLAAATMVTQSNFSWLPGGGIASVQAAETDGEWVATNYVTNGDFETGDFSGWTLDSSLTENGYILNKADTYDATNATNALAFQDSMPASTAFSISQEITLPAGSYYISASNQGKEEASFLTLALGEKQTSMPATTGWAVWATATTESDPLVLSEETTVTVSLTGSAPDAYWGSVDNIIVYKLELPAEYTYEDLSTLLASVPADYASMGFTADSVAALTSAQDTANACTTDSTADEICDAYNALQAALNGLVFDADIFVEKIENYDEENSIRGVDVSSYLSLMDSFAAINANLNESDYVGFHDWEGNLLDEQGFFHLLAASGINYIRTRVWNNPATADGNGYGGGNNDLAKAVEIGKYATNAGMNNLIDFHFSDFWADPAKQTAPKAWASYSVSEKADAISEYVTSSLTTLKENGVNVGMVQIGNETNGKFCGESNWSNMNILFDAGCDAVHAFNETNGTDILAVLHFTNPETAGKQAGYAASLSAYDGDGDGTNEGVSYDVFATSYYPYWHGTLENLTSVLTGIASKYDKYVMVAETSWATTLADGDGHDNTVRVGNNDTPTYTFSVQGQANEVRSVINAVNQIDTTLSNGKRAALGAFYWEPAWIPVQYAYDENGKQITEIVDSNKEAWETYGSGWAASYGGEFENDAAQWYGGSAVDNQAVFDFNGYPLASLNVFKYLAHGAIAPLEFDSYRCDSVDYEVGTEFTSASLPSVTVIYNDGSENTVTPTWNDADIQTISLAAASNSGIGTYTVHGSVTVSEKSYDVACTVNIVARNLLIDNSFEEKNAGGSWTIPSGTFDIQEKDSDAKSGSQSLHFYSGSTLDFTASQTVTVDKDGIYSAFAYIQGLDNAGSGDGERIYLSVTNNTTNQEYASDNVTLNGWVVWQKASIAEIPASAGDELTISIHIAAAGGTWGTADDFCLYLDKTAILSESTASLTYGEEKQLSASLTYEADETGFTWESSDPTVVSVDENGLITAQGVGTATITATSKDSYNLSDSCEITVTALSLENADVTLSQTSYVHDGSAKTPDATVTVNGKTISTDDYTVSYQNNTEVGTATVTITGQNNCTGSTTAAFYIANDTLENATVTLSSETYTYDGTEKKPEVTVTLNEQTISAENYDVSYENNINAGTATVIITSKGTNYAGSLTKDFTIEKCSLTNAVVTLTAPADYTYDGTEKKPEVTVTLDEQAIDAKDYDVAYTDNTNAGTATVTITGKGNYKDSSETTFTIGTLSLESAVITLASDSFTYDGTAKKPAVAVTLGSKTLDAANDYTVAYSNNINVGTATVTVTGKNNYTGTASKTFTINEAPKPPVTAASITGAVVKPAAASYTYNGKAQTPGVTVTLGGKTLTANDYTVAYTNNINAGTATITVTGKNSYTGTATGTFKITKASKTISAKSSISKAYGSKAFSIGATTVKGEKLTYSTSDKKVVNVSSTGKVTIKGIGKATITIKSAASKNYNAAKNKKVAITITPKKVTLSSVTSKKKAQMTVKWKRDSKVTGYQIVYSTKKNFKGAKTITIKSNKITSKTITSKLVKGKKYYVKVRAYKTVKGKKITGPYSNTKTVTVKKK